MMILGAITQLQAMEVFFKKHLVQVVFLQQIVQLHLVFAQLLLHLKMLHGPLLVRTKYLGGAHILLASKLVGEYFQQEVTIRLK